MDEGLLKHLGISDDQVQQLSGGKQFPNYFDETIEKAQTTIISMMSKEVWADPPHWAIPEEQLHRVFDMYKVTGNWRKTNRQLGVCRQRKKVISINFGHSQMTEKQCYKTMVHEYIHAIQYRIFGVSGHDKQFWFYLHLCVPVTRMDRKQKELK